MSLVSRLLYKHTVQELYRSITLRTANEYDLASLGQSILVQSAKNLQYVKDLQIVAPFCERVCRRCPPSPYEDPHNAYDDEEEITDEDGHDTSFDALIDRTERKSPLPEANDGMQTSVRGRDDEIVGRGVGLSPGKALKDKKHAAFLRCLASRTIPLFQCLTEGNLQSFWFVPPCFLQIDNLIREHSWEMGTCIPRSVADYIARTQSQITSLTIITDNTCKRASSLEADTRRLCGLNQLRRISWTTRSLLELRTLGILLRNNAVHLQDIQIDCVIPESYQLSDYPGFEQFPWEQLLKNPGMRSEVFLALRQLALSYVPLVLDVEDFIVACRMSQLRSLRLQDCLGANKLLDQLASSPQAVCLTFLELGFAGPQIEDDDLAPLMRFLRSFRGLEHFFVLYPGNWTLGREYWDSLSNHHSSLRRVVHQESGFDGESEHRNAVVGFIKALGELERIECLSTCARPDTLVSV